MSSHRPPPRVVSVTQAASQGIPSLVRKVESGEDLVVERHGQAVAAVVSMSRLKEIEELEQDLRESVLLLSRLATDTGKRTELDDVISAYGFDRDELEHELKSDEPADQE